MHVRKLVLLAALVVLLTEVGALAAGRYRRTDLQRSVGAKNSVSSIYKFTSFDPSGSVGTFPVGINNNGLIAGQYIDAEGMVHTFLLRDGKYTIVDVPGAAYTLASQPNMQGQVALAYLGPPDYYFHQALYSKGEFTFLPDAPGQLNVSPAGLNSDGHISGVVWSDDTATVQHGYVWDGATFSIYDHPNTDIPFTVPWGINNQGLIVGQYNTSDGVIHGFLKSGDAYFDVIVGTYGDVATNPFGFGCSHGFMFWKQTYMTFDYPDAQVSYAMGVNDKNQIVGLYVDTAGNYHGYLATPK
jgi:uncharacterized membrane protein